MPYKIYLKRIQINVRNTNYNRGPHTATLLGTNTGSDWVVVSSWSNLVWTSTEATNVVPKIVEVESTRPYSAYVMVVHKSNNSVDIAEIKFFGVPEMDVTDGRQLNVGQVMTGSVGIGTTAPYAPLTVFGRTGAFYAESDVARAYFHTGSGGLQTGNGTWSANDTDNDLGIYSYYTLATNSSVISMLGTLTASDVRIKKEILDVEDSSALDTFRLLQPKLYNYIDVVKRGATPVWGFIAQEVGDTLTYSTNKRAETVPNVYELANVYADGTVLEFDTTKLEMGASKLRLYDRNDNEEDVDIDEVIDEYTVRLAKPIKSRDQVFVYGQEVADFHFLKKDAIWTTAAAALQEVDRRQQADEKRLDILEEKDSRVKRSLAFTGGEGLLVDATGALSNVAHSKTYLGVVGTPHGVVETSGEVHVWVSNENGDLEVGDYLTTSNVAGYAMRQDDDLLHNYTVGKVLEVCDFTQPQVRPKVLLTETRNVQSYVKTLNVSLAAYSNLASTERFTEEETYYEKTSKHLVKFNDIVNKMPSYDEHWYYKTLTNTINEEVYDALPTNEKGNYILDLDTNVYTYTQTTYLTDDTWNELAPGEQNTYTLGYFKIVTEEASTPTPGYTEKTRTIYKKIVASRDTEASGYTLHVRQEEVPVLDAYGNKQYTEDWDSLVDAYEMRYIDGSGTLTTRHNAEYHAALLKVLLT